MVQSFTGTGGTATWVWDPTKGEYGFVVAPPGSTPQAPGAPASGVPMQAVTGWQIVLTDAQINKWAADAMNERRAIDDRYDMDQRRFGLDVANANWQRTMAMYQAKNQRLQYEVDKQRLGLEVAESNRAGRAQELTAKMQALQMLADRKGPQDWVAYNNLVNMLAAPDPESSQQIDIFAQIDAANLGELYTATMPEGPSEADANALGTPYVAPPTQQGTPPRAETIPVTGPTEPSRFGGPVGAVAPSAPGTRSADSSGNYAGGGTPTGPVVGFDASGRPIFGPEQAAPQFVAPPPAAPASGYAPTPFNPLPAPPVAPPPVAAPTPASSSPSGYSITPFNPPQQTGGFEPVTIPTIYPYQPEPIPATGGGANPFGSPSQMNPANPNQFNPFGTNADYQNYPAYAGGTAGFVRAPVFIAGDPLHGDDPNPERVTVSDPEGNASVNVERIGMKGLKKAKKEGAVMMATGGTIGIGNTFEGYVAPPMTVNTYSKETLGSQPFMNKLRGAAPSTAFTGYGTTIDAPSIGMYDMPAIPSLQRFNRLLPSEQLMTQGAYEEGGQYFADIYEKARRAAPAGRTMGPAFYGGG